MAESIMYRNDKLENEIERLQSENAALKKLVAELVGIADEYTRIRSIKQKYYPEHNAEWVKVKAIIENAKSLIHGG